MCSDILEIASGSFYCTICDCSLCYCLNYDAADYYDCRDCAAHQTHQKNHIHHRSDDFPNAILEVYLAIFAFPDYIRESWYSIAETHHTIRELYH